MARYLQEHQIAEYRDCFNLHDEKQNGRIMCSQLITVMRKLGACPTQGEVKKHLAYLQKKPNEYMDFSQFLTVMHRQTPNENVADEISAAMQLTSLEHRGKIPKSRLRYILMNTGEKLSSREVDQMFRAANIQKKDSINYREFVHMIMQPIPDDY
uniref:Calmodulin-like protein 4 n=1 Tax=Ciona intestinalis TaxID=7719 RepID=H2Y0G2_CIOIN|nr:calmodulin-like protein 4 [Ciona intestinalis]|eukprot:XP_002125447.1 calmodulin-like protein 4 [Ciona intestinalis]